MITTSKAPQYSYLRRLCGLALMVGSALALTLTVQQATAQKKTPKAAEQRQTTAADTTRHRTESKLQKLPFVISADSAAPLYILEGKEITATIMQAIKPEAISEISIIKNKEAMALYGEKARNGVVMISLKKLSPENLKLPVPGDISAPIYFKDGMRVSSDILKSLPASEIASVNVLKGQEALDKYGEEGKNGAVEIVTKSPEVPSEGSRKGDTVPTFPGGIDSWRMYLAQKLNYPEKAQEAGIKGVALISFMVAINGDLSDFEIVENPGFGLGEEALRLLKTGPKWLPAIQNGQKVPARMLQKVTFQLE